MNHLLYKVKDILLMLKINSVSFILVALSACVGLKLQLSFAYFGPNFEQLLKNQPSPIFGSLFNVSLLLLL